MLDKGDYICGGNARYESLYLKERTEEAVRIGSRTSAESSVPSLSSLKLC